MWLFLYILADMIMAFIAAASANVFHSDDAVLCCRFYTLFFVHPQFRIRSIIYFQLSIEYKMCKRLVCFIHFFCWKCIFLYVNSIFRCGSVQEVISFVVYDFFSSLSLSEVSYANVRLFKMIRFFLFMCIL